MMDPRPNEFKPKNNSAFAAASAVDNSLLLDVVSSNVAVVVVVDVASKSQNRFPSRVGGPLLEVLPYFGKLGSQSAKPHT